MGYWSAAYLPINPMTTLTPYIPEISCDTTHVPLSPDQIILLTEILGTNEKLHSKSTLALIESSIGVSQYHPEVITALSRRASVCDESPGKHTETVTDFLAFLWEETMPDGCEMAVLLFQNRYGKLLQRFPTLGQNILFRLLRKSDIIDKIDADEMQFITVTFPDFFWTEPGSFACFLEEKGWNII